MKIAAIFLIGLWLSIAQLENALAQEVFSGSREYIVERFSVAGKKTALGNFVAIQPNCVLVEWQDISITRQPEHGKAVITNAKATLAFPKDNPRSRCNGKTVASKRVEYVPSRDYKGDDEIVVEGISGDGGLLRATYRIVVK